MGSEPECLLRVQDLEVGFRKGNAWSPVLRGVSFEARAGEMTALVGESGCGKSLTALALLDLLPPGGEKTRGEIYLRGFGDLSSLPTRERRRLRGRHVAMIFQDPTSALNPVLSVGRQLVETVRRHRDLSRRQAESEAEHLLETVMLAEPRRRLRSYPHQLSGGQLQRIMIAMALACEPDLLLADEPTTALDVTVQAQVLELLQDLRERLGLTVLLITHDLALVAENCDRLAVMYAGQVVEEGEVRAVFREPAHPYTRGLLDAVPRLGSSRPPQGIPGRVPELGGLPSGCTFAPRCSRADERCRLEDPARQTLQAEAEPRSFRCWHPLLGEPTT